MRWTTLLYKYRTYAAFIMLIVTISLVHYERSTVPKRAIIPISPPIEGTNEYHFYNKYHYGDSILNLKFFYNISDHLRKYNITIHYYYNENYIKNRDELERYVNKDTMFLHTIDEKPERAIELWLAHNQAGKKANASFDEYFEGVYKRLLNYMGIGHIGIETSLYQKEEYLLKIYDKLPDRFKNAEILFINAAPQSAQFAYNKKRADEIAVELSKQYRIVTTSPVNEQIPCTFTAGLKLQDIGAVSTHARYIIGVNSGPLIPCLNYYTKQSVKKWIFVSKENFTQIPYRRIYNYSRLKEITISEIEATS